MKFRFIQNDKGWNLIDDDHPGLVIASLTTDVEIVALRSFCEHFASSPDQLPEHFPIDCKGKQYVVTPIGSHGERLTLLVRGADGTSHRIETALVLD